MGRDFTGEPQSVVTRRQLLWGVAAAVASPAILRSAGAQPVPNAIPPLQGGQILKSPTFPLNVDLAKCIYGYRPHRAGGVRLEAEAAARQTAKGPKHIVHNYGHGGAGITLSWGCAAKTRDLTEPLINRMRAENKRPNVAILGMGVIGLTAATEIQRMWPGMPITVYAKSLDVKQTVSWVAGGQFEPSGIWREYDVPSNPDKMRELHDLVRASHRKLLSFTANERRAYGIVKDRKNYTFIPPPNEKNAFKDACPRDVIPEPKYGYLPFRSGTSPNLRMVGFEYNTWLVNPQFMMPKLMAELRTKGVKFEARTLASQRDIENLDQNIVVNCTGLGARELFNDTRLYGIKGQLFILPNPDDLKYFFSGGCGGGVSYVFTRQNDIVVGGSYERPVEFCLAAREMRPVRWPLIRNVGAGVDRQHCQTMLDYARAAFAFDVRRCGVISREQPPQC